MTPESQEPARPAGAAGNRPIHPWLHKIHIAFVPGEMSATLEKVIEGLLHQARLHGHEIQETPDAATDVILTTAPFGEPLNWRKSLLLSARRRFGLQRTPTVYTFVHVSPAEFQRLLDHFDVALAKEPVELADFDFPGLAPEAYRVLVEQGRRGGPILALERLVQAQAKCIRILLLVGDESPEALYHFDLVGAYPRSEADELDAF